MSYIHRLNKAIDWELLETEFKNSLIFAFVKEGLKDENPDRFDKLLNEYIGLYKQFLFSTDIFHELTELDKEIKKLHEFEKKEKYPSGKYTKRKREKQKENVQKLTTKIIDFTKCHQDDVPLPLLAKGLADTTDEKHSGLRAFQIIKWIFRYLIGIYRTKVGQSGIEVKIGDQTESFSIWQQEFLTSNLRFFVPKELMLDYLSNTSRRLVIPVVIEPKIIDKLMSNLIAVTPTSIKREELDLNNQYLIDDYEKRNPDLGDMIEGYEFSPFWFYVYGLVYLKVVDKHHSTAIEWIGQVVANTILGSMMSVDQKDKDTTQRLMAITGSFLMINTFFHSKELITTGLKDAPLFLIGQTHICESVIIELAEIFLKVAFNRSIKVKKGDVASVLNDIFSSEMSRLYTFRYCRSDPVTGRIEEIGDKPQSLKDFENKLYTFMEQHSTNPIYKEIISRLIKEYPDGRGEMIVLEDLFAFEIGKYQEKMKKQKKEA